MNRYDQQHGDSGSDDFWGAKADWTTSQQPTTQHERFDADAHWAEQAAADAGRPAARFRRGFSKMLSSGSHATREHGIVRPDAAQSAPTPATGIRADMFDDLDDVASVGAGGRGRDDFSYDDTGGWVSGSTVASDSMEDDSGEEQWDAELEPAPHAARSARRTGGFDPLLVRIGAVAVVGALLVPLMLNIGADDGGDRLVDATASSTAIAAPITLLPTTIESTTIAPLPIDATTTQLDPNDLPAAVPVNAPADAEPEDATSAALTDTDTSDDPTTDETADSADEADQESASAALTEAASADEPAARTEPTCAVDYTVVDGDYWIRLADAADVDLDDLLDVNAATASSSLYPGAEICLPAGATTPAPPATVATTQSPVATTDAPTTTQAPTTTVAPVTTPATTLPAASTPTTVKTPVKSTVPASSSDVEQIIRDVWPDELEERALEIAYRESRYSPTAKNYCCYGVFQIYWNVHKSWLGDMGITDDQQLFDPATNARAAYALYQRSGGWGPWGF